MNINSTSNSLGNSSTEGTGQATALPYYGMQSNSASLDSTQFSGNRGFKKSGFWEKLFNSQPESMLPFSVTAENPKKKLSNPLRWIAGIVGMIGIASLGAFIAHKMEWANFSVLKFWKKKTTLTTGTASPPAGSTSKAPAGGSPASKSSTGSDGKSHPSLSAPRPAVFDSAKHLEKLEAAWQAPANSAKKKLLEDMMNEGMSQDAQFIGKAWSMRDHNPDKEQWQSQCSTFLKSAINDEHFQRSYDAARSILHLPQEPKSQFYEEILLEGNELKQQETLFFALKDHHAQNGLSSEMESKLEMLKGKIQQDLNTDYRQMSFEQRRWTLDHLETVPSATLKKMLLTASLQPENSITSRMLGIKSMNRLRSKRDLVFHSETDKVLLGLEAKTNQDFLPELKKYSANPQYQKNILSWANELPDPEFQAALSEGFRHEHLKDGSAGLYKENLTRVDQDINLTLSYQQHCNQLLQKYKTETYEGPDDANRSTKDIEQLEGCLGKSQFQALIEENLSSTSFYKQYDARTRIAHLEPQIAIRHLKADLDKPEPEWAYEYLKLLDIKTDRPNYVKKLITAGQGATSPLDHISCLTSKEQQEYLELILKRPLSRDADLQTISVLTKALSIYPVEQRSQSLYQDVLKNFGQTGIAREDNEMLLPLLRLKSAFADKAVWDHLISQLRPIAERKAKQVEWEYEEDKRDWAEICKSLSIPIEP